MTEGSRVEMSDTRRSTEPQRLAELAVAFEQQAVESRKAGEFEDAARLFAQAAEHSEDEQMVLHLQIRQACCLLAVERSS